MIETETPLNSIGSAGARFNSEAPLAFVDAGAGLKPACAIASSPGASPGAINGVGLPVGVGDGDGVGLPVEVAVGMNTGPILAPVKSESVAVDSVVIVGDR